MKYSLISELYRHLSTQTRLRVLFLLVIILLSSLAEVVTIGMVIPFLSVITDPDKIANNSFVSSIFSLFGVTSFSKSMYVVMVAALFSITIVVSAVIRIFSIWYQTRLSYSITGEVIIKMFSNLLSRPFLDIVSKNSSHTIADLIIKTKTLVNSVLLPFITLVASSLLAFLIISFLAYISGYIAIVVLGLLLILYSLVIINVRRKITIWGEQSTRTINKMNQSLSETLGSIKSIILNNLQSSSIQNFSFLHRIFRRSIGNVVIASSSPRYLIESLILLILVISVSYITFNDGGNFVITKLPLIGAFILALQRLIPVSSLIYSSWGSIKGSNPILRDILKYLNLPVRVLGNEKITFTEEIKLQNVSFQYPETKNYLFTNLNLVIGHNEVIGIVGPSGDGKSTLINILTGLLFPTSGSVIIDNQVLNENNLIDYYSKISYVSQTSFFSDNTLLWNITLENNLDNIDFKKVNLVIEKTLLSSLVEKLPDGLNTKIGENGSKLSGGQKQRLSLARALYSSKEILVLDEATSALDSKTEKQIINNIIQHSSDITIIMVAHRISTLKNCSKIIEISGGKITNNYTYSELVKENP